MRLFGAAYRQNKREIANRCAKRAAGIRRIRARGKFRSHVSVQRFRRKPSICIRRK
jgi:hypothetical protein